MTVISGRVTDTDTDMKRLETMIIKRTVWKPAKAHDCPTMEAPNYSSSQAGGFLFFWGCQEVQWTEAQQQGSLLDCDWASEYNQVTEQFWFCLC